MRYTHEISEDGRKDRGSIRRTAYMLAHRGDHAGGKRIIPGPSVIRRNNSDGGYLQLLRNESAVKAADCCLPHGTGSP
jgi:hypothetical protein